MKYLRKFNESKKVKRNPKWFYDMYFIHTGDMNYGRLFWRLETFENLKISLNGFVNRVKNYEDQFIGNDTSYQIYTTTIDKLNSIISEVDKLEGRFSGNSKKSEEIHNRLKELIEWMKESIKSL